MTHSVGDVLALDPGFPHEEYFWLCRVERVKTGRKGAQYHVCLATAHRAITGACVPTRCARLPERLPARLRACLRACLPARLPACALACLACLPIAPAIPSCLQCRSSTSRRRMTRSRTGE